MDAKAGTPEAEELELIPSVEIYGDKHYPMNVPDPVEAIKFRMEQLGLNQQKLVPFIESKNKVSEVLNRKRPVTKLGKGCQSALDMEWNAIGLWRS